MNENDFNLEEIWEGWIDQIQDEIPKEPWFDREELEELEELCF